MRFQLLAYEGGLAESLGVSPLYLHRSVQYQCAKTQREGIAVDGETLTITLDDRVVAKLRVVRGNDS